MSSAKRNIFYLIWVLLTIVVIGLLAFNFASPAHITFPSKEEQLIRFQLIIDDQQIDFAQFQFQEPNSAPLCSEELASRPFGFYQNHSQILNLHWDNVTGVEIMRNYGFNNTGPFTGYLGVRLDDFPKISPVSVHGDFLTTPQDYMYYVYTGNQFRYSRRDPSEFLNTSIEKFIENDSRNSRNSWIGGVTAQAQISTNKGEDLEKELFLETTESSTSTVAVPASDQSSKDKTDQKQTEVEVDNRNSTLFERDVTIESPQTPTQVTESAQDVDVLGNIIVFIQKEEPSELEVTTRFLNLEQPKTIQCN